MTENQAIAVLIFLISNFGAIVGAFWKLNNEVVELKTIVKHKFETQERENVRVEKDLNSLGNLYRKALNNNKNQEDFI